MIIFGLILLGLCMGSFVNALVWRIHKQSKEKKESGRKNQEKHSNKYSILHGRSMCTSCKHQLSIQDLIPVLSWLSLGGKCRYCKKPISWQYPAVELATAILFVASYIFWPKGLEGLEVLSFALWLVALVGLIALLVYDLRWMLLPNRIVFPLAWIAGASAFLSILPTPSLNQLLSVFGGVLVGGGIFYIIFQVSDGKWIGGGDVKLGFVLGLLLASPGQAFLMIFLASLGGTAFVLPLMLLKKISPKTRIPFGPFLIISTVITQLFGAEIINLYVDALVITG